MIQISRFSLPLLLTLAACQAAYPDPAATPANTPIAPINTSGPLTNTPPTPPATQSAPTKFWGEWDEKNNPLLLGNKVVDDLIPREFPASYIQRGGMDYREVCTAYGSVRFAGTFGDKDRLARLVKRYEVFFTTNTNLVPPANNVDNSVFGILPHGNLPARTA